MMNASSRTLKLGHGALALVFSLSLALPPSLLAHSAPRAFAEEAHPAQQPAQDGHKPPAHGTDANGADDDAAAQNGQGPEAEAPDGNEGAARPQEPEAQPVEQPPSMQEGANPSAGAAVSSVNPEEPAPQGAPQADDGETRKDVAGPFTIAGGSEGIDYSYDGSARVLTIQSGKALSISSTQTNDRIVVGSSVGANLTLAGVNIKQTSASPLDLSAAAASSITVAAGSTNTLDAHGSGEAGIRTSRNGALLTITCDGTLNAFGDGNGAGIGGNGAEDGGSVTFAASSKGTVNATSNYYAAGIGGGGGWGQSADTLKGGSGGTITIEGGTINAASTGRGAGIGGGFGLHEQGGSGGTITITGGTVNATGGKYAAGIGGGGSADSKAGDGGTITIKGGIVHAQQGDRAAGIGGGGGGCSRVCASAAGGDGGSISITGGTVYASGIGAGVAIITSDYQVSGKKGQFSTKDAGSQQGNAFIDINWLSDTTGKDEGAWSGVIFVGDSGSVYGSPTLATDATVESGKTLTVPSGKILTIDANVTFINIGTIENQGEIVNYTAPGSSGKFINETGCTINNYASELLGAIINNGMINNPSAVAVAVPAQTVPYGSEQTLSATVTWPGMVIPSDIPGTVDFYLGDLKTGAKLGSATTVRAFKNGPFTASLTLSADEWANGKTKWDIGPNNPITAVFEGAPAGNGKFGLVKSTSSPQTMQVAKGDQVPDDVQVNPTDVSFGSPAPVITPLVVADGAPVAYSAVSDAVGSASSDVASIDGTTITLKGTGTFYVKAVIDPTDFCNGKTVYSAPITVKPSDSSFTTAVRKGDEATSDFTYGDTITIAVSGITARPAASRNAIAQNEVYLFASDPGQTPDPGKAIASATVSDGAAALAYRTTDKKIKPADGISLWVVYGGNGNLNPSAQEITGIRLSPAPLGAAVDGGDPSAAKTYDASAQFSNVALSLSGLAGADAVAARADGASASPDAGESGFSASAVRLSGADKDFYALSPGSVGGDVRIDRKTLAPSIDASHVAKTYDGTTEVQGTPPALALEGAVSPERPVAKIDGCAYDSADAGSGKAVNATVSLTDDAVNANYTLAATSVAGTGASVARAPLVVAARDNAITYGDAPANAGAICTGFVNGENADSLGGALAFDYSYNRYGDVGAGYAITPTGYASNNYAIEYQTGSLTVKAKQVGLIWDGAADRVYGDGERVSASATGTVNGDAVGVIVQGGDAVAAGAYTATATGLVGDKAANYRLPDEVEKAYTIDKAAQDAPHGLVGKDVSVFGKGDGAISNLTSDMECSSAPDGPYVRVADPNAGFFAGTYWVRYAGDANRDASPAVEVRVGTPPEFLHQTVSDSERDASLTGLMTAGAALSSRPLDPQEEPYERLAGMADAAGQDVLSAYELSLSGRHEGRMTLSFKVGAAYDGTSLCVYHQKGDGSIERLVAEASGGSVAVDVDGLSPFLVAAPREAAPPSAPVAVSEKELPKPMAKTGDGAPSAPFALAAALAGVVLAAVGTRRRLYGGGGR